MRNVDSEGTAAYNDLEILLKMENSLRMLVNYYTHTLLSVSLF